MICPPCEITDQLALKTSFWLLFYTPYTTKTSAQKASKCTIAIHKIKHFLWRGRPLPIPHSLVTLWWIYSRASVFPFLFIYDTNTAWNDPPVSQPCQTAEGNTKQWLQPWKWSTDLVLSWSTTNSQGIGFRILYVRTRAFIRNDALRRMTQQTFLHCQVPPTLCLDMLLEWMSWLTPIEFCLHNRQITGEDPQGGHAPPGFEMFAWPVLIWHGAARSQGGSSEPNFLADVNEAQC